MKTFKLPVTWLVSGKIEVEAETLEEAIKFADENLQDIDLPEHPEYICDSFRLGMDEENIDDRIEYYTNFNM